MTDPSDLKAIADELSQPGTLYEQRHSLLSFTGWRFDGIFKPAPDNANVYLGRIYRTPDDPTRLATRYVGTKYEDAFTVRLVKDADGKYVLQPPIAPELR